MTCSTPQVQAGILTWRPAAGSQTTPIAVGTAAGMCVRAGMCQLAVGCLQGLLGGRSGCRRRPAVLSHASQEESIPGWVVDALRRHRDEGWPIPQIRTQHHGGCINVQEVLSGK